jgi:hypothetical protein
MASAGPFDRRNARAFHLHAISSPANDRGNPAEQVDRIARFFGSDPQLRGADLFAVAAGKLHHVSPNGSRGAIEEGNEMNRLRRFYEKVSFGRTSSRVAYATSAAALPEASPRAEWAEDATFNAGDAILADPLLKDVYKQAILKGCAFEKPRT